MSIRHDLGGLSQKDAEDIAQTLEVCSKKLEKFPQNTRANGKT
jgi:hypothetical protein